MERNSDISTQLYDFLRESSELQSIPTDFIERFVYNYEHQSDIVGSEWLYSWFTSMGNKLPYNKFCSRYLVKLPNLEYKLLDKKVQQVIGHNPKILYEVTQIGVKLIMMMFDDQVRLYFIKCEQLIMAFFKSHIQKQEEYIQTQKEVINKCTQKCYIYRIDIYDITGEWIEFQYIGSTTRIYQRRCSHKYNSTNTAVRKYVKEGRKHRFIQVADFTYIYKEERDLIEQNYINLLDPSKKLNAQNPVKQQTQSDPEQSNIEESKEPQIQEQIIQGKYSDFRTSVDNAKSFIAHNKRYPNKRSINKEESKIGHWVCNIRVIHNKPEYEQLVPILDRQYLQEQLPDFIWDANDYKFEQNVLQLAEYIRIHQKWPHGRNQKSTKQEGKLERFIYGIREAFKNEVRSTKLTQHRIDFVNKHIPTFKWKLDQQ